MRRRKFITFMGAAAAGPLAASAQQPAVPVVGFIRDGSAETNARNAGAFRKGLNETGYVEGQNVKVEYYWLVGQYEFAGHLAMHIFGDNGQPICSSEPARVGAGFSGPHDAP